MSRLWVGLLSLIPSFSSAPGARPTGSLSLLERITEQPGLPELLERGYRVLVDKDVSLHLLDVTAYKSGVVELRHEVRR